MAEEVVNRLKAEGQLIRNTGTNSIRSVRIQLDRFEDIFKTISENIQLQTQMLTDSAAISAQQLKISEETAERDAARAAREELAQDQTPAPTPDSTSGKKTSKDKDRTGAGLFSMIGGLNLRRLLFGGALIAGGGFAAYNVLKGFIDEKTGGGFSDFEDGIVDMVTNVDFSEITESFKDIKDSIDNINETLTDLADTIIGITENFADVFGNFSLGNALKWGVISATILKSPMPPHLKALALGSAAALYAGMGLLEELGGGAGVEEVPGVSGAPLEPSTMEETISRFKEDPSGLSLEERQDLFQSLRTALEESEGTVLPEFLRGMRDELNDALNLDAIIASDEKIAEMIERLPIPEPPMMQGQLSQQVTNDVIIPPSYVPSNEVRDREMQETIEQYDRQFQADRDAMRNPQPNTTLGGGQWPPFPAGPVIEVQPSQVEILPTTEPAESLSVERDQSESSTEREQPESSAPRSTGSAGQTDFDSLESIDYQNMSNQELLRLHHQLRDPAQQAIDNGNDDLYDKFMDQIVTIDRIIESRGLPAAWDIPFDEIGLYRRGTKGFQDFGPASFAILHGREAVVPEETPAGRFLNQFFTEDWTPKMAPSSDLSSRVTAASTATVNMPIIVNNSPTVAPVVNNVQGGPSVTNTNLFGSGGGDRSRNPYGLPDAIN